MSVLVLTEDDLRRILREELRSLLGERPPAQDDRRVTRTEAAAAAGVSPATLDAWADAGRLKRYGEGRNIRFSLCAVLAVQPDEKPQAFSPEDRAAEILRGQHG